MKFPVVNTPLKFEPIFKFVEIPAVPILTVLTVISLVVVIVLLDSTPVNGVYDNGVVTSSA